MKKNILSILTLICAVVALIVSLCALASVRKLNAKLEETPSASIQLPSGSAYCDLFVGNWRVDGSTLKLDEVRVDVQLPNNTTCLDAQLVLYCRDEVLENHSVSLAPGEAGGSLFLADPVSDFSLPALQEDDELALWLELTLSDGTTAQACGAQWYQEDGTLLLVAG